MTPVSVMSRVDSAGSCAFEDVSRGWLRGPARMTLQLMIVRRLGRAQPNFPKRAASEAKTVGDTGERDRERRRERAIMT